jgi:hypothetical protein
MKNLNHFFMPLMALSLVLSSSFTFPANISQAGMTARGENWQKFAERKINLGLESEQIALSDDQAVYAAIKIKVRNGGINLLRCVIQFKNGKKKSLEMRNDIAPGGESRVIQLQENNQPISKISLWFKTGTSGGQVAAVEIWGKPPATVLNR